MGIRDDELDGGLFEAFKSPRDESALEAIARLHGAGESVLLRDAGDDASPVLLRRAVDEVEDDARYQVLGEIARGGIGIVYKGRDRDLNRDIALKVLRPEYAERDDVIQRFIEEAQVGGQLQHPGIVPVYGLGIQKDGRPSFAMKLIKGQTLAELLANNPPAAAKAMEGRRRVDLLTVFEQVAQTIAYAHSRGVIHRDLKPANVMVGAFGEVQVVDWGFAKVLGQEELAPRPDRTVIATVRSGEEGSQSIAGSIMGTPAYMPPEQALGHIAELDEASDVFALGAILCEILTGKPPYTGKQKDQLVAASQCLLQPAFERLDEADADDELKRIVRDCLQPLGADRPRHARVLADRLSTHFAQAEERARQAELDAVASESHAAREQHARRRTLVLATAALLLIVVGAGGFLWSWLERTAREEHARPRIATALREAKGFEGEGDWTAAVAAAQKAVDLAASEGVDDGGAQTMLARLTREKAAADKATRLREADEALLAALEDIRARRGDEVDDAAIDEAYVAAITERWPKLEVDTDRLRASPHALSFAAVFDAWAHMRRLSKRLKGSDWRRIDRIARAVDPSHSQLRDALADDDPRALAKLAESEYTFSLPPALLTTIGTVLRDAGLLREAMAFLQRVVREHPDDFWAHYRLGTVAAWSGYSANALRHWSAALAIRPKSIEARAVLGQELQNAGDLEGAIAILRDALALKHEWVRGLAYIANALEEQGKHDEAEAHYLEVIELSPEDAYARAWYGHFLVDRRRYAEAVDVAHQAVQIDPDAAYTHRALAVALRSAGDLDGALAEARKAVEMYKPNVAAWSTLGEIRLERGEYDEALAAYRRWAELWPHDAHAHTALGVGLQHTGDVDGAIRAHKRAIELDPKLAAAHLNLGAVLCDDLRRYDEAMESFRRAIELDPNFADAWQSLGIALRGKGELDDALRAMRKAIELDPERAQAHITLGTTLCDWLSRYDDAIVEFKRAIEVDPDNAVAHANIGVALRRKGDVDAAVPWFRRSIELGVKDSVPYANLGFTFYDRKEFEEAIVHFRRALKFDPGDTEVRRGLRFAYTDLGAVRLNQQRFDESIAASSKAIELDPEGATAHHNLANALYMSGRLAKARRAFEKAIELEPSAPAYVNLGAILCDRYGRYSESIVHFRRALEVDPNLPQAQQNLGIAYGKLRLEFRKLQRSVESDPAQVARTLASWKRDPAATTDRLKKFWADVDALLALAKELSK